MRTGFQGGHHDDANPADLSVVHRRVLQRAVPVPEAPPPIRRALSAPSREIGIKIAALLPLTGPSFSYARNLNDSIAIEGAFDIVSLSEWQPSVGLALAQVRFSENAGFGSRAR